MQRYEADVVVIGGGLAGHTAALTAAEQGVQVLLVEKQPEVGGSTVLSGGSFAFAGTDMQEAAGIEDTPDLLYSDLRAVGGERNDPDLVRLYADRQLEAYRWLRGHDVDFGPIQISSGQSVPRLHPADPREVIRLLNAEASRRENIELLTGTAVRSLTRDSLGGPVTGLLAERNGEEVEIAARRGVVLASGGFSRNPDLIETFVPNQRLAKRVGGPGNVGDGLRMAWKLGAGFRDVGYVKGTFGNHPEAGPEQHTAITAVYKGAIAVNLEGRRFANESISYKLLGDACLRQTDQVAFQIFDAEIMKDANGRVPIFDFERRVRDGLMKTAPTLAELAGIVGVDAKALEETVARYNGFVEKGLDEDFGRTGLSLGFGRIRPIATPPFYAYPSTSAIVATYCGLTVDTTMAVLDVDGAPIGRLFSAGELVGGFHGEAYMTGTSLGKCVVCGREAGRQAAQLSNQPA